MMLEQKVLQVLSALGQMQLLKGIEQLSLEKLSIFLAQLQKYDPALARKQKELVLNAKKTKDCIDQPCIAFERSGNAQDDARGQELVRQGKVGCLIMAGGQGTRLGYNGPKGAVPVTPIMRKSLFQLFCERVKAASSFAERPLPLCIMTSPLNHDQTITFFEEHSYFGLCPLQVTFFQQEMLPFLDDCGHWLLEEIGKVAESRWQWSCAASLL